MKLPPMFQRLGNKEPVLRVNEIKNTVKDAFNVDYLETKGNHESSNVEKNFFGLLGRFSTHDLALKLRNVY